MAPNDARDLHICIIGAGMGGLATALALAKSGFRHIDVYELASNLGFVGAGIQLAPNMARILDRLGVWKDVEKEAVDIKSTSIRDGATDSELSNVDLRNVRKKYTYPHMVGHRSSLAGSLYQGCKREKAITFFFSTAVNDVKSFGPRPSFVAVPRKGETYIVESDILLAADGIKSTVRERMLEEQGIEAKIVDTGQAAYRIMLKREQLEHDPELLELIEGEAVTRWIGEKRHVISYPVSNNQIYNIVTVQPDRNFADAPSATYTTKGSKPQMMQVFDDYCPKVKRMLDLVPDGEVCEWRLRVHEPLDSWVQGQTALVGDACHATLPHMGQGAAQAIEDAAVLSVVLSRLPDPSPDAINKVLRVYQDMRMGRAYRLVEMSAENGRKMHLGKGAAKDERDKQFEAYRKTGEGPVPDRWADSAVQRIIYGDDVTKMAVEHFDRMYAALGNAAVLSDG